MDIEILNENRLRYWCGRLQLPDEAVTELARIAALIVEDDALLNIFRAVYEKTALKGEWHLDESDSLIDPLVTEKLGEGDSTVLPACIHGCFASRRGRIPAPWDRPGNL